MTVQLPHLETERLVLDAPRLTDFAGYASIVCGVRGGGIGGPRGVRDGSHDGALVYRCTVPGHD